MDAHFLICLKCVIGGRKISLKISDLHHTVLDQVGHSIKSLGGVNDPWFFSFVASALSLLSNPCHFIIVVGNVSRC